MLSIYWVRRVDGEPGVKVLSTETLGIVSAEQAHDQAKRQWPKAAAASPAPDGWQIVNALGIVLIEQFPADMNAKRDGRAGGETP